MRPSRAQLLLLALTLTLGSTAHASTWYVDGNNGDDANDCKTKATACGTIAHAVSLAASGDSIKIADAFYQENLTIPFSMKLIGAATTTTIIDGGYNLSVISISRTTAHVALANLTLQKGAAPIRGGGVYNYGILTVTNTLFRLNTALSGGAISARARRRSATAASAIMAPEVFTARVVAALTTRVR